VSPEVPVHGVLVLGAYDSGVDLVQNILSRLGFRLVGRGGGSVAGGSLARLNARLFHEIDGESGASEGYAPHELRRLLAPFAEEAGQLAQGSLVTGSRQDARPWVWADPLNSLLADFWVDVIDVPVASVLVHRAPEAIAALAEQTGASPNHALARWDQLNRAAIVHSASWPTMILSYEELIAQPKARILELVDFLEACGVKELESAGEALELVESASVNPTHDREPAAAIAGHYKVLAGVLSQLRGWSLGSRANHATDVNALMSVVSGFYDEDYYGASYDKSGVPYNREEKTWTDLFSAIGASIVETLHPKSVLDVGCASGMLVEALRERRVEARGIDISHWAIDQVPLSIRPYCTVGTITDEIEGHYELITCSEVLEHLPPFLSDQVVANLCRHTDTILFSSTSGHFDEPTHLNVEPAGYWAQLFFRQGFVHDVDYDASYLAPHAVLFRRDARGIEELIADYERGLSNIASALGTRIEEAVAEHDRLASRHNELARHDHEVSVERDQLASEVPHLRDRLDNLERRRSAEVLSAFALVRRYEAGQRQLAGLLAERDEELSAIRKTKTFRYTVSMRRFYGRLRRARRPITATPDPAHPRDGSYATWIRQFDTLGPEERARIDRRLSSLVERPKVSVIMPVFDPPPALLTTAIESVMGQVYENWELCIADDCSQSAEVAEVLNAFARRDPRIKVTRRLENGHISAASNTALAMATGEWITCLDHDDLFAEHALALAVLAIGDHPGVGIVYSDEDKVDEAGDRHSPFFKPDFDPLLLLGQNYMNHLCMVRRDLVEGVGGYRQGYEGSQDWDLLLRVSERLEPTDVVHVPHVLYHWRSHEGSPASLIAANPYATDAGRRAVVDHIERVGRSARVTPIALSGHNRVTWTVPDPEPLVSIIIPTRDGALLPRCIESLLSFTTYTNFEVVVVDNGGKSAETLHYLQVNERRFSVIRDERPFNFSALNNAAVRHTSGEIICLLNDDTEVMSSDWLGEMVGHALQPGVGAVGAKLYYDDGRIQHAGVVLGILGVAGHSHRMTDRLAPGYFGRLMVAQNLSAVTAACVVVRREAWESVGGLDEENLAVAFNDVDFCLRLREAGWRVVWTPQAELFHHESVSRGPDTHGPRVEGFAREGDYMQERWGPSVLRHDPFYNPNLSLDAEDFSLAWPPRVSLS
jgi:GT2 family glycosyltransferase/cyclopropane fatty-acyl-phospholipid synthase-like methyltransferase